MQKHAAATASNINNFYGRKTNDYSGINTKNDFGAPPQNGGNY